MIALLSADRRTVTADIPADLMGAIDRRDESLRLAAFRYSAQVVAGQRCDFRDPQYTHNTRQTHERFDIDSRPQR